MRDLASKVCGPQAANGKRARAAVAAVWERSRARVCVIDTHTHIGSVLFPFEQCQKEGLRGLSGRSW